MIVKDYKGNELMEILDVDENSAMEQYAPVTHCLAVVMVGGDYLLGWNRWRKDWEIFGGCMEEGETMRECITRECLEEIGLSDLSVAYIGLMHLKLMPDYFQLSAARNTAVYMESNCSLISCRRLSAIGRIGKK